MKDLKDNVVVITGGNSGIGLATTELFKGKGAKVITNARSEQRKAETLEQHGDLFDDVFVADVSQVAQLEAFFNQVGEKYKGIDVLFLNAGIALFAPIEASEESFFDQQFNVNVKGVYFGLQKALPYLAEGSSVVANTSIVNQMAMANGSVYAATKAAVKSLVQTTAGELKDRKIRVNAVSPGPIETPIFGKMGMPEDQINEMAQGILSQVAVGRFGSPAEIADGVLFLTQNEFITGTEVVIDGGMSQLR